MAKKKKKLHAHRSLVTLGMILAPRSTKLRDKRDRMINLNGLDNPHSMLTLVT